MLEKSGASCPKRVLLKYELASRGKVELRLRLFPVADGYKKWLFASSLIVSVSCHESKTLRGDRIATATAGWSVLM